jgi:two-component system, cell cycle sensor histidine kinase and response regulator CckA
MQKRIFIQQILWFLCFLFNTILFFSISPSVAAENVTLQLKWKHQFQFAGYYAAIEKGYYKQEDLDVTLIEGKPGENEVDEVISGRANFGVGMADILLARLKGEPVVILANIFQHSPSVFLAIKGSGVASPQDLFGKKIMITPGYKSAELQAILANEGISIDKVTIIKPSWKLDDLISGKVTAMATYISSAPYFLKKKNIPYIIISPTSYGIDFYGDNLFTSEQEINQHPHRVSAFMKASLKGWQYALNNPEEIVDIILSKYASNRKNLTKEFLVNEASSYQKLILPQFVKIGHMNPGRWKHIADTYVKLGMADKDYSLEGLIYDSTPAKFDWGHWAIKLGIGIIIVGFVSTLFLLFFNRRLNIEIYDRKKVEKALKNNQNFLNRIIDQSPFAIWVSDEKGTIIKCNLALTKLLNITDEQLIGKYNVFEDEIAIEQGLIPKIRTVFEDGKTANFSVEWDANELGYKDAHKVHIEGTMFPIHDDKGDLTNVVNHWVDITKREQAEKTKTQLEIQLQQSQKMESIGTLAGGIAHDFNNLLYPIIGFAEMLKEDLPQDSPEHEMAQEVFNAGRRGGELVKQILAFSRQSEHKLSPVRFQKILTEVCKLTRSTIPSDTEIHQDIQMDCGLVMAEETQLHQIAMNLITNAYHAVEKTSGEISIQLKEIILDNDDLKESPLQPGQYVTLSVSDNGVGIPREIRNNIFEPYFTTKEKGKGTGLGLAVVYGILTEHKGDIKVYSEEGKGTTFNVYLPLMKKSDETISTEKILNKLTGTERILLVDDEESVVRLEKQMLERLGYNVSALSNSLEALEAFNSIPDGYDLVISDMTMPNLTGDELAQKLMSIRSDIPIIICTGFSERINKEQAEANKIKGFLMKPVVKSEMAQMVRKVLDEAKVL